MPLRVAALPLHPLVILLALALCAWWMLIGRVSAARLLLLAVGAAAATLLASTMLFGGLGTALYVLHINPTYIVGFARWWWGASGVILMAAAWRYVRGVGLQTIRERCAVTENSRRGGCLYWMALAGCSALSLVIFARYFINDSDREGGTIVSIPYRLFEWGIVDRIPGPISDECLANRVLEYSKFDKNGTDARDELDLRKKSAVPGVVARMDQLADNWPPKPHTVTHTGIVMLLNFLKEQGEVNEVHRWEGIPYDDDMMHIEPSSGWLW